MASKSPKVPHNAANTADLFGNTTKPSDQIDRIAAIQASHPDRSVTESERERAPSGTHQVSNYPNDAAVKAHPANVSRVVVVDVGTDDTPLVNTADATTVIAMSDSGKKRTPLEFSVLETTPADVLAVATGAESVTFVETCVPDEPRDQSTEPDQENSEHFKADCVRTVPQAENPDDKKIANTDCPDFFVGDAASQESEVSNPVSCGVVPSPSNQGATLGVADHPVSNCILTAGDAGESDLASCHSSKTHSRSLNLGMPDALIDRAIEVLSNRSSSELGCSAGEYYPGHALHQHRLVEGGRVADQAGVAAMKTGDMSDEINHSEPPPADTDFVLDEFAKLPKTDSGVVRTGFVLPRED
jgi:hypothetical protein